MNTTTSWNFDHQPIREDEAFSFGSFITFSWILLGGVVMAVLCWFGCTAKARGNCSSFCKRTPYDRAPARTQVNNIRIFVFLRKLLPETYIFIKSAHDSSHRRMC